MKLNLIRLLIGFTITCAVTSCRLPGDVPQPPEDGLRCSFSYVHKKFRCLDLASGKHFNVALSDSRMEGAEATPLDDALAYEGWIDKLETWAATHCQ